MRFSITALILCAILLATIAAISHPDHASATPIPLDDVPDDAEDMTTEGHEDSGGDPEENVDAVDAVDAEDPDINHENEAGEDENATDGADSEHPDAASAALADGQSVLGGVSAGDESMAVNAQGLRAEDAAEPDRNADSALEPAQESTAAAENSPDTTSNDLDDSGDHEVSEKSEGDEPNGKNLQVVG